MSDILIKNMKMPETCADCNFSTWNGFESVYCDVNAEFIPRKEWKEKRQDWCPLIEVSTPHGDLIDKTALLNHMTNVHKEWQEHPDQHKSIITIIDDELIVDFFPAIIEAEGKDG